MSLSTFANKLLWGPKPDLLPVGSAAPDVSALDQHGVKHALRDYRGTVVAVYFYPRDETPGCTRQACTFRDAWSDYEKAGVRLFGVSTDSVEAHRGFAEHHGLPFPLLADPDGAWAAGFGVPLRRGMAARSTFLIDRAGNIAAVFPNADPALDAANVLSAASKLVPVK